MKTGKCCNCQKFKDLNENEHCEDCENIMNSFGHAYTRKDYESDNAGREIYGC